MPSTALHATVLACVLLAGCAGVVPSGTETTTCPPATDYESKPLPEKPTAFTADSVAEFAEAYEETMAWNDAVEQAETSLSSNGSAEVVNRTETGYVVHVTGGASYRTCTNGATAVADNFFDANYFVNETTVVRLETPENRTTNPRVNNGTIVETWKN